MSNYSWPNYRGDAYHTGLSTLSGPTKPYILFLFRTRGSITSSPAIDSNGNLYFGTNGAGFYKISSNGTELWRFPSTNNFLSSPALSTNEDLVYIGEGSGFNLYALSTTTGSMKWISNVGVAMTSSPYYYPKPNGDEICVTLSNGDIATFDASNGGPGNYYDQPARGAIIYSSPVVYNGVLYVGTTSLFGLVGFNLSIPAVNEALICLHSISNPIRYCM